MTFTSLKSRRTQLITALVVAGSVSVAACSSGSPAKTANGTATTSPSSTPAVAVAKSSSGGAPNPCSLLTNDQVSAVLGGPVTVKGPTAAAQGTHCDFDRADGNGAFVMVQVYKGAQYYSPAAAIAPEPIPGVGDQSYLDSPDGQPRRTAYVKGETAVLIEVQGVNPTKEQLIELTKDTLAKI